MGLLLDSKLNGSSYSNFLFTQFYSLKIVWGKISAMYTFKKYDKEEPLMA